MTALVAVLAGGAGRRMGATPKPLALLGGRPLIAWPLAAAAAAGLEAVVVAKPDTPLPDLGDVAVWHEPAEPRHPLLGIVTALERAGRPVVAAGCDQPWLPPGLLAALAAGEGAAAPRAGAELAPLPARYPPQALPALRAALAAEAPLREALAALSPAAIAVADPGVLASVDTPEALAAAGAPPGSLRRPMTAEEWIAAYAEALGRPAPGSDEIDAVLALASVAAHASERRAAPVACWLAAAAGVPFEQALALAERVGA